MSSKLDWTILFWTSAVFAVLALYVGLHDIASINSETIERVSGTMGGALGMGWVAANLRSFVKFWL